MNFAALLSPPKGAEGSEGVGEGDMTSPITVMEWPGYSWLHTGVFSLILILRLSRDGDTTPFKH